MGLAAGEAPATASVEFVGVAEPAGPAAVRRPSAAGRGFGRPFAFRTRNYGRAIAQGVVFDRASRFDADDPQPMVEDVDRGRLRVDYGLPAL
jgi:hypothetical protein